MLNYGADFSSIIYNIFSNKQIYHSDEPYDVIKVMKCTINDVNLSFDKDNRLRKTILKISGHDATKAYTFAAFLNDKDFKKFLLENINEKDVLKGETILFNEFTVKDYVKINQNKLRLLLNTYYVNNYHSVNNSKTNKGLGFLDGFSSGSAKDTAKVYTASLIIDEYRKEIVKDPSVRRTPLQIISDVNAKLLETLYDRTNSFAEYIISNQDSSKDAKDYAQHYIDTINKLSELIKETNNDNTSIDILQKQINENNDAIKNLIAEYNHAMKSNNVKAAKSIYKKLNNIKAVNESNLRAIKELKENIKKRNAPIAELNRDRYVIAQNLINVYSGEYDDIQKIRLTNFANLVTQSRSNSDSWYFQVFNTKNMTSIIKDFNNIGNIEEFLESENGDTDELTSKYNEHSIDETAKSWEDHLYRSFDQTINGKLKIILSSIPKLSEKYNGTDSIQTLDTNNELGVPTYMDLQHTMVQIYSFGDFSDVQSMITSLETKSNSIKSLYGLGYLINSMKERKDFANFCFVNFAKPIVKKTMITIDNVSNNEGVTFDISNPNAVHLTELVFRMTNKLKATYNNSYEYNDIETLNSIIKEFKESKKTLKDKEEFSKKLFDIVNKYFPNFNKEVFSNYFDNIPNKKLIDSSQALVINLQNIIRGVQKLKNKINTDELELDTKNKEEFKKFEDDLTVWQNSSEEERANMKKPVEPVRQFINYANYDLTPEIYSGIINFVKQIITYTDSKARLNTANAEGNSASDVIKNCFVSRFFEQINAGTEEDANAGLKNLLSYITQGSENGADNQYSNNPLFFGLKDENGKVISEGLFIKTETGYEVNPNAKYLLSYNLFDGAKNNQDNVGTTYEKMSKLDFFITQYNAFNQSLSEITEGGKTKKIGNIDTAVYSMRIGSDAPKIFFIKAPRYNYNQVRYAFYNHVIDELHMFCKALTSVFTVDHYTNVNGVETPVFKTTKSIQNLIGRALFDEKEARIIKNKKGDDFTKALVKNGRLVGNAFKFNRLFEVNGYNAGASIEQMLSLYGGGNNVGMINSDNNGRLVFNPNDTIIWDGNQFVLNLSDEQKKTLKDIVRTWTDNYLVEAKSRTTGFIKVLEDNNIPYSEQTINMFLLNSANMNMNYDDLFEGDYKYYNNARDFLKRTKETQAGGDAYAGYSILEDPRKGLHELKWFDKDEVISINSNKIIGENGLPIRQNVVIDGKPLIARNGWKGVTIYNTNKASDYAEQLQKELEQIFINQGMSADLAKDRSTRIASGYGFSAADRSGDTTKINDAQSYITLEEFIRRKHADGTIQDYAELIEQLLDDTPIEQIDIDKVNAKIQVQKNFYFDKIYNSDTGLFYPRQIKNAEFVLIPKLLPEGSELRKVYDFMQKHDIGQLNTAETSKAAKKDIFTIWDYETGAFNENFEEDFDNHYIENYYYQYLYKQQDVPQHMKDETNKFAVQIAKKILDNIINESDADNPDRKRLIKLANDYQNAFAVNIEESYFSLLTRLGWEVDTESGELVNINYATTDSDGNPLSEEMIAHNRQTLNFDNFYKRAREEAARLGMDSNLIEYFIPDEFGNPKMPNYISLVKTKLESIAQSIFNGSITRQTLPGWHAAQITAVGYSKKLKFDPATGVMEVYLPRWSRLIPKTNNAQEEADLIKQMEEEGLDIHLGYRIPTEGKQSIAVLKVVGFTNDCLGSTIVVPDEWVTQTGSDFDVDSVYGICWEMYATKDKTGKVSLHKIPFKENEIDERSLYIKYVNDQLENRVTKTDLGDEIEDNIKKLKDKLNNVEQKEKLSEEFNKLQSLRNECYTKLPGWARGIIKDENANAKTKENKSSIDLTSVYTKINDKLNKYLVKHKVDDSVKNIVEEYTSYQNGLLAILSQQDGLPKFNKDIFKGEKAALIEEIVNRAKEKYFEDICKAANEIGILSFNDWSKQDITRKLDRRARNNFIIDKMIEIMNDPTSREEQYGRSNFEKITNGIDGANDIIDKISGESSRKRSPYNPLDQLDFFEDAMGGTRLKALSVNWDTFTSKNNRIRASLDNNDAIEVELNVDGISATDSAIAYNLDEIKKSYGDDIQEVKVERSKKIEKRYIINKHSVGNGIWENIYMSEYRIKELIPIIKELVSDDKLISIPWKEFVKYNKEVEGFYEIKREIYNFLDGQFGYRYEDIPFKKGEFYLTKPLYELLTKTTPLEFCAIIDNVDNIKNYDRNRVEKTINNEIINQFLDNYKLQDDELLKVIKQTIDNSVYVNFDYSAIIDGEILNNKRLKEYPKSYDYVVQQYNNQNNIKKQNRGTKIILTAKRLGWSNNNRNIVGELVTTYTSQTTAHHLDAVKMGSVPNVDEYTFNVYKLFTTLGLDYEFAIGFIRQPIITNLVQNNNLINSVYFKSSNNPIYMTIIDIAKSLGLKDGKYDISYHTPTYKVLDLLKADAEFVNTFYNLFGVNIQDLSNNKVLALKVPLNKERLFTRIKRAAQNKGSVYENAAFDLAMLLNFRNYKRTAEKLNKLITVASADKYGAATSLRETRRIIKDVEKLRNDFTLSKNGKSFIDLMYPLDENENVDVESSSYKPIAAIYKYGTKTSLDVNKQLFITENDEFVEIEEIIQSRISHIFTESEYKEYQKYAINYLYNRIAKLLTPLYLDNRGRIVMSEEDINEEEYWNKERSRIYGYGVATDGNLKIKNVNNPTPEEIKQFNKLTPAQKVLFIQKNFADDQGIFNYIKVTLLNNTDVKYKGISRQYLAYDDQVNNIETLFSLFINSFSNHNPLIKLATIDLIKYSFVAEGYNFKSSYISKMIPNRVLYSSIENGGIDIIDEIKRRIQDLPKLMLQDNFVDNFVRSHSDITPIIRLPKLPKKVIDKYTGAEVTSGHNITTAFKSLNRIDGLIHIDTTTNNDLLYSLIDKLQLKNYNEGYIRVNFPLNEKETRTILYKVIPKNQTVDYKRRKLLFKYPYADYFLIPLNLLDRYENYDYSYNQNYNIYNSSEYYYEVVRELSEKAHSLRLPKIKEYEREYEIYDKLIKGEVTDQNNKPVVPTIDLNVRKEVNQLVNAEKKPVGNYSANNEYDTNNPTLLMELQETADAYTKGGVDKLVKGIIAHNISEDNFSTSTYAQLNNSAQLRRIIPEGKTITQEINLEDGSTIKVMIKHLPMSKDLIKAINTDKSYEQVRKDLKNSGTLPKHANIYKVAKVIEPLKAATELIEEDEDTRIIPIRTNSDNDVDVVSKSIIDHINYISRNSNDTAADRFMKELEYKRVDRFMKSSRVENRKNIYTAAANYYQSSANYIMNKLDKFVIEDKEYSMDDPELYRVLIEHDEYFPEIAKIILDGLTFGDKIAAIEKLDIFAEDKDTKEAIERIINNIRRVKQNNKLQAAMANLINIYFKKYSTNPNIVRDLVDLRETFGDSSKVESLFLDPFEINSNEAQVILKKVTSIFTKAEMFDAKRNVEDWKKQVAVIENMTGSLDMSHIIDFDNWKLRSKYNENFVKERKAIQEQFDLARIKKDDSFEDYRNYVIAKYDKYRFYYENTETYMVDEYWEEDLSMRKEAMRKAGDNYYKYLQLMEQLYNAQDTDYESDEEKTTEIKRIKSAISQLYSETDITGSEKSIEEAAKARALKAYREKRKALREKYFDKTEYEGFKENYIRYKNYITQYDAEHPYDSLNQKLENIHYKEAYDWIKNNGILKFSDEAQEKLNSALKTLTKRTTTLSKKTIKRLKNVPEAIDIHGNIDPRKLTDEQIELLKAEEESELSTMYDDGYGEAILIKEVPSNLPIMVTKGNDEESKKVFSSLKYKDNNAKFIIIKRINEILSKAIDRQTNKIDLNILFNDEVVSDEERIELANLYNKLRELRSDELKKYKIRKNKVYTDEINYEGYLDAFRFYKVNLQNTKHGHQFLNIFTEFDEAGNQVPNTYIYGYKTVNEEFIDHEKTNARDFINDNVEYVETDYYHMARQEASEKGVEYFEQWFKRNHIYNPYTHKYQPLKIWTKLEAKPNSELANSVDYVGNSNNVETTPKERYINPNYSTYGDNYSTRKARFNSSIILSPKEEKMRDLIEETLHKYAKTNRGKRFVGQGYLPRERKIDPTASTIALQTISLVGLSWNTNQSAAYDPTDEYDYANDKEVDIPMLELIKDKTYLDYEYIPGRGTMDSEQYTKVFKDAKARNEERRINNEKIDKALVNRNLKEVMEHFIHNATIFNAKQETKPYLYLLMEDVKRNDAYLVRGIKNNKLTQSNTSSKDDTRYKTVKQEHTEQMIKNITRRLVFDKYYENSSLKAVANLLQNMSSSKYMVGNVYGGIANVTIGKTNIAMEQFAGEYFDTKDIMLAEKNYLSYTFNTLASMYSEEANNIYTALMKRFDIVNYDNMTKNKPATDINTIFSELRNFTYSTQGMGEHFMQNTVLLAMLKSHRLYTDRFGVRRIGNFRDYTWDIEQKAMENILEAYPDLKTNYKHYLESIKYNVKEKLDIESGSKDYNRNFLWSIRDSSSKEGMELFKTLSNKYKNERNKLLNEAKKEFYKYDTIEDLFELRDGKAELKEEKIKEFNDKGKNLIGDLETLISEFKSKVVAVNKKIHGVYDRLGAGGIENKWYGGLMMQFRKHIYPGFMKRYRRKGYHSEFRNSIEKGSDFALAEFLATEFTNFNKQVENKQTVTSNKILASTQVILEATLNTFTNACINWGNLAEWEKDNMRRNLGDLFGALASMAIILLMYSKWDDDEIKESEFKSSVIYLADRLYSDSTMFTPFGLVSEAKTAWSSPFAAATGPSDLFKVMELTTQMLFDPNYNPEYTRGIYAGRNKIDVLLRRQIPGIRNYDRIRFITKQNKYYKVGESNIGINIAKTVGENIHDN